jgi:hypothetical protein
MSTNGGLLAFSFRVSVLPFFRAYQESILTDVLSGFADIESRADRVAHDVYEQGMSRPVYSDYATDGELQAEAAMEAGRAYYETMAGLRQAIVNLLAAGLFHLLEQQLMSVARQRAFSHRPLKSRAIWEDIANWYNAHLGLDFRTLPDYATIDELRLLANAVKHAEGSSEAQLRGIAPELFENPVLAAFRADGFPIAPEPLRLPLAGDGLYVTEERFGVYATAVRVFVEALETHFRANGTTVYPIS